MRWLFTAPGDNAFLVHPSVSSGRGDQAKAPHISVASDQSLSSRVTNEEGKGPEQIYLRKMFSLRVGLTGMAFFFPFLI